MNEADKEKVYAVQLQSKVDEAFGGAGSVGHPTGQLGHGLWMELRSEMSRWNSLSIPPKLQLRAKSGSSFTRGATESKEPGNGGQIWVYESMSPQPKDKKDWRFGKDSDTVSTAAVSRQDLPSCQKGCLSAMEGGCA